MHRESPTYPYAYRYHYPYTSIYRYISLYPYHYPYASHPHRPGILLRVECNKRD